MPSRLPSLLDPPVGFAHRGGRAHAPENTLEAFRHALELGAGGLESDVWLTRDGVAVLDHDGVVRRGLRRRPIADLDRAELPGDLPALEDLYRDCGDHFELSLDLKDPAAARPVLTVARAAGPVAVSRLWLCHPDLEVLVGLREVAAGVRLVCSTRLGAMRQGPERFAADLAAADIDAVNLHHEAWTGGLTTLFHRFRRLALGWDCQHERILDALLDMGIDGVFSDHVDRLVRALTRRSSEESDV